MLIPSVHEHARESAHESVRAVDVPFHNPLSEFVFLRTYARWVPEEGRRELTWGEAVDRYVGWASSRRDVPRHVVDAIRTHMLSMGVLPSMRALWSAGPAADRDHVTVYNCSFLPVDCVRAFSEALYVLMCGTGVGFSVEREFVDNLPEVGGATGDTVTVAVADSTEGWADALYEVLVALWRGHTVRYDVSAVRPRGEVLRTKGGRASGPEPLVNLFDLCARIIDGARGRRLRPIEAHDIMCTIGEIVMVGGFRRAALISFSDPDDEEMRHAKDWSRGDFPVCRYMANNSAHHHDRPTRDVFDREWSALRASGSGERGLYRMPPVKRAARRGDCRSNPCGEILLRYRKATDPWTGEGGGGQFCNLSAAVMRADDTVSTMCDKVRVATWIGAIQASFTDFPYLRPAWRELCEEDRLLGVDITGQCDNPRLSQDPDAMETFNRVARETAAEATAWLGINYPAAITCGKPSGNSSQLVDCASGFHPRFAPYYIRRVRTDAKDPLTRLLRDSGVPMSKENGMDHLPDDECPVWVVEFPVKAPDGAMLRDSETAVQMLERYLHVMRTWCGERGHNQSITVYVRDHEWDEVGDFVFDHFDEITGVSFLPFSGGKYKLAPYEEIDEATYRDMLARFPTVAYDALPLYERADMGQGAQELACMGGSCELV
jgi:ribonucleoside-triphosphate reductase